MTKKTNQIKKSDYSEQLLNNVVSVGTFKPKFNPQSGRIFSDELNILGTAFFVDLGKTLVTCAHVVNDLLTPTIESSGLLVIGYKGKYFRTAIGIVDNQHDLAVLKIIDNFDYVPITGLKIISNYQKVATRVLWAGYPLGNFLLNQVHQPTYSEGVIGIDKRVDGIRKNIQISGTVVGGYSGSPVVEENTGSIVGVVAEGPQNSGIFMAISFEHVNAIVNLANS
ncbi:MAG: serine protease [Microgenomates group bacterium]